MSRLKTVIVFILTYSAFCLLAGWSMMLAIGIVHHEWIPQCPTIGFWWAVLLSGLLRASLYQIDFSGKD